ncbi:MAG: alcohol dehydrogenase catalytic domain-containing protein [Nitrospinota bacterium]|nr:alcohol dehydrogenase catalytic domain-containing protein [Nitrospinota bacterium]
MSNEMKAMRIHKLGGEFQLEDVPMPKPGPNEALLKLKATGVGLTLAIMRKTEGLIKQYPRIMGHEIAGEVVELGSEVPSELIAIGDMATCHFYLTCKNCNFCRSGRESLCENFKGFFGLVMDGGYAEYTVVPAVNLCKVPIEVNALDACLAADAICTPYHNCVTEAQIKPGDIVAICGAGGGVAIHAVQMAQLCGGHVIGLDVSNSKLDVVSKLGAFATINPLENDVTEELFALTNGKGVDIYIDYVATKETLENGMNALGRAGKLIIVGYRPPSAFEGILPEFKVDPLRVLNTAQEIHGSRYCSMDELRQSLELLRQKKIKPIVTETFKLKDLELAFQALLKNEITGRAAILFD